MGAGETVRKPEDILLLLGDSERSCYSAKATYCFQNGIRGKYPGDRHGMAVITNPCEKLPAYDKHISTFTVPSL